MGISNPSGDESDLASLSGSQRKGFVEQAKLRGCSTVAFVAHPSPSVLPMETAMVSKFPIQKSLQLWSGSSSHASRKSNISLYG